MNTMKWLLKREFWENKGGFFWAPVIAGSVFLVLNIMGIVVGLATAERHHIQLGLFKLDSLLKNASPEVYRAAAVALDTSMLLTAVFIMAITAIVVFFYSIASLYDERRDRSILFWKSLPLSDTASVVSKAVSAAVVAPAIGIAAGLGTAMMMLLIIGVVFMFHGQNVLGFIFGTAHPFKVALMLLASLPIAALWALPTIGWLMLCSVWARTKPLLWAVALPVGAGVMVSWFDLMQNIAMPDSWFWKNVVARMLLSVMPGSWMALGDTSRFERIESPEDLNLLLTLPEIYATLGRADLWVGVIAGLAMLALAVRLRRWRDDG